MTDRHAGYLVVLEKNIREDDAEPIIAALKMVKGVLDVQPIISDPGIAIAQSRAAHEFKDKLVETFFKP